MSDAPARRPERPPTWSPADDRYWDARDLEAEWRRAGQVCHECRMCVNFCGSFPIWFDAVDDDIEAGAEGAERLSAGVFAEVSDHCWQCKLCYIKCPYTEDEGAPELLDIPRLLAREKAHRARRDGVPLVDRVLGEPQRLGALAAGRGAKIVNLINANRLVRDAAEKVTGVSAEFALPPLATQPFPEWFREHAPSPGAGEHGEVVLFPTCYGDYNYPHVPAAAVLALEKNGYAVRLAEGYTCCGMPNLDGGDVAAATAKLKANVAALIGHVRAGRKIVVPGPTCGYTLKQELPLYVDTAEARQVAEATVDLMEFFDGLRRAKTLNQDFELELGKVVYHAACHLRAQKVAIPGARVLAAIGDSEVRVVERCSAVDGTWGMKAAYYTEGRRYARHMVKSMTEDSPDLFVGDCQLAGQRLLKESGARMIHPVEALAASYGLIPLPESDGDAAG